MTISATRQTIHGISAALQLASLLDDRAPRSDKPRIAAWSEQVQRHNLTQPDMLDAVQAFYDEPHDHAIGIGDLIHHGRRIKRNRLEREAHPRELEAKCDAKAADEMRSIAAGAVMGPAKKKTQRLLDAEDMLQATTDKASAQAAIREYFAAKANTGKANA